MELLAFIFKGSVLSPTTEASDEQIILNQNKPNIMEAIPTNLMDRFIIPMDQLRIALHLPMLLSPLPLPSLYLLWSTVDS
ncbi:unnamed protein product [Pseudo-nitzschia multistriata]|uniref:Uncharacterized protein n=1 Tax=Pseudo-nitzschia multistriata TaxID=183589 RepID=A0A448Z2S7_9STRA|nr:unnamed protein product [Pseudo-nitzschia multistriata]